MSGAVWGLIGVAIGAGVGLPLGLTVRRWRSYSRGGLIPVGTVTDRIQAYRNIRKTARVANRVARPVYRQHAARQAERGNWKNS